MCFFDYSAFFQANFLSRVNSHLNYSTTPLIGLHMDIKFVQIFLKAIISALELHVLFIIDRPSQMKTDIFAQEMGLFIQLVSSKKIFVFPPHLTISPRGDKEFKAGPSWTGNLHG